MKNNRKAVDERHLKILNMIRERGEVKVEELAKDIHSQITGTLEFSSVVQKADEQRKTVIEAFGDSDMAWQYRTLAKQVLEACGKGGND